MLTRTALGAALAVLAAICPAQSLFDESARHRVKSTLEQDVHLETEVPPYGRQRGAWQVRLTPEGSKWLYDYQKSQPPEDEDHANWTDWIEGKIAYDKALAARKADRLNGHPDDDSDDSSDVAPDVDFSDKGSVGGMADLDQISGPYALTINGESIENPGPIPEDLSLFVNGQTPTFYAAVKPLLYKVSFGDESPVSFVDQAPVPDRYLYYRSSDGVISGGTPLKSLDPADISALCDKAGIDPSTWRVMRAVSSLEGGFDSINTYDTGYISAGFIQFTTGASGAGSLAKVLLREKQQDPSQFDRDFRRYGIDVTEKGVLDVYDASHEKEVVGSDAVQAVIHDKRLTAVLVHAGRDSDAFKVAQLKAAKDRYYPGDEVITLKLGGAKQDVRVGDVVRSEAGMAILMDRKVNTGSTGSLPQVMQRVADECQASSVDDLAAREEEIVSDMKFRRNFLQDLTLTQPGDSTIASLKSRGAPYPRDTRKKKSSKSP